MSWDALTGRTILQRQYADLGRSLRLFDRRSAVEKQGPLGSIHDQTRRVVGLGKVEQLARRPLLAQIRAAAIVLCAQPRAHHFHDFVDGLACACVVDRLVGHPGAHRTIADHGDNVVVVAGKVTRQILAQLSPTAGDTNRDTRKATIHQTKSAWLQELSSMDHEDDDPGTTWNADARTRDADLMSPRMAWRAIQAGFDEIKRIERLISSWDPHSQTSAINAARIET